MTYTKFGPFTDGGAPGVSAEFLNPLENFLVTVNSAATDASVSSSSGIVTLLGLVVNGAIKPNPTAVTITGTTAGSASLYQFFTGTIKGFWVYFNGYENTTTTEQKLTLPQAITTRAAYFAVGGIPMCHFYQSGTQQSSCTNVITGFPSGSGAGAVSVQSTINGFQYGEIIKPFTDLGCGVSMSGTSTSSLLVIGI